MDKIILTSKDVETLLTWRDQNINLVRQSVAPFKAIILDFPETNVNIKAINDTGRITFYLSVNGQRAGKLKGLQLPAGFIKISKNTTKLQPDNIQSIITVYSSLMALIAYHKPAPAAAAAAARKATPGKSSKAKQHRTGSGLTYILRSSTSGPRVSLQGSHASPAGAFNVRGHFRQYKDGRRVWIKPYKKGTGKEKNKTYKL